MIDELSQSFFRLQYSWIVSIGIAKENPLNQPRIMGVSLGSAGAESLLKQSQRELPELRTISKQHSASSDLVQNDEPENEVVEITVRAAILSDDDEIFHVSFSLLQQAKAVYTYQANVNDPNELSFEKGEILKVLDRKGKWWKARRQDGTIGIIPSNYMEISEP